MKRPVCVLMCGVIVAAIAGGCPGPKAVDETGNAVPNMQEATPSEKAAAGGDRVTVEELDDEGGLGVYSTPGDLPALQKPGAVIAYADLDGDGRREALSIAAGSGGTATLTLASWGGEQWETLATVAAGRGESAFDEDSIVLAYDMDQDDVTEIGIAYYEDGPDGRDTHLYLYKLTDGEPALALDKMTAAVLGAITFGSDDGATVADVTQQFPGDELLVTGRVDRSETAASSPYHIHVYGWVDGAIGPYLWYSTEQGFANADAAVEAFLNHEGDYRLDKYEAGYYDPELDERFDARSDGATAESE